MKTIVMISVLCAAILLPMCAAAGPIEDRENRERVLFYYGCPSSFNYPANGWSIAQVADDMAQYDMVVLGAGLEATTHPDHSNTILIVSQMPDTEVYGYVTLNQPENTAMAKINQWNTMGVAGIFLDEAGYDFGTGRAAFNRVVNHIHAQSSANIVFVNAWYPDHVMSCLDDVFYPNTQYNPACVESELTPDDWYLLESCPIFNRMFMSNAGIDKCNRCVALRRIYGINLASVSMIENNYVYGRHLYNRHVTVAWLYNFDAEGTSDLLYGAASSQVKMW